MSRRDTILNALRAHEHELRTKGVAQLFLFGSIARDDDRPDSDVDLFFEQGRPGFDLIDLLSLKERVTEILGRSADVMTRGSLHPEIRGQAVEQAVRVF